MPTYNTPERLLSDAISSVRAQLYPEWELCIADDASSDVGVVDILDSEARRDHRIRWMRRPENGHISAATNTALAMATGEFVALMDHDDLLSEHALYQVALEILACPEADVIYSDEDRIDEAGNRDQPYFKPMWSPELLAGHNMISHLGVYRRSLLTAIGGLRVGFEGSQDWDLALRATSATTPDRVRHIPAVLYHWRWHAGTPSFSEMDLARCQAAGRRAVENWLQSEGIGHARVEPARLVPGWNRVAYPLPNCLPLVSVIIPTRNRAELLARACVGVMHKTAWPDARLELLIVDNGSEEPDAIRLLEELEEQSVRVLRVPGPFNFAKLNNLAIAESLGSVLVLLNNDVEVIDAGWLTEMVSLAIRPEIGVVGAKLLYPDNRVQHAGVLTGPGGHLAHALRGASGSDPGYCGQLALARSLSAVTGACMAVRREVYDEVGGLDEELAVSFNDVDFCLRVRDHGYRVVWTPDAVLTHYESASRGLNETPEQISLWQREWAFMHARWGESLNADPYHNPNLLLHEVGGPLIPAFPRRAKPWRVCNLAGTAELGS